MPLSDELALLDQLLSLATISYGLKVDVHVDAHAAARWQIPPVVLPELLDNAVKHNEFTTDTPLEIEIRLEGGRLTVPTRSARGRRWSREPESVWKI